MKTPSHRLKLMPRFVGPFKIVKRIGQVAYELELPAQMKVHDVFHVSLLKRYHSNGSQPPPPFVYQDNMEEYAVERILAHRDIRSGRSKKQEFLVKWVGYPSENNTWEPAAGLKNCKAELQKYWSSI